MVHVNLKHILVEDRYFLILILSLVQRKISKRQRLKRQNNTERESEDVAESSNHEDNTEDYVGRQDTLSELEDDFDDAEYSEDVTPLVLAAQLERSDMIEILLKEWPDIHPVSRKYTCLFKLYFI